MTVNAYLVSPRAAAALDFSGTFDWAFDVANRVELRRIDPIPSLDARDVADRVRRLVGAGLNPVLVATVDEQLPRSEQDSALRVLEVSTIHASDVLPLRAQMQSALDAPDRDLLSDLADFRDGVREDLGHCGVAEGPAGKWTAYTDAFERWLATPDGQEWFSDHPVTVAAGTPRDEFALPERSSGGDFVFRLQCAPVARLIFRAAADRWESLGALPAPEEIDPDGTLRRTLKMEAEGFAAFMSRVRQAARSGAGQAAYADDGAAARQPFAGMFQTEDGRRTLRLTFDPASQKAIGNLVSYAGVAPGGPGVEVAFANGQRLWIVRSAPPASTTRLEASSPVLALAEPYTRLGTARWDFELDRDEWIRLHLDTADSPVISLRALRPGEEGS